jgi:hypothetical protein
MHGKILKDGHHVSVVKSEQFTPVHFKKLIAAEKASILTNRTIWKDRPFGNETYSLFEK